MQGIGENDVPRETIRIRFGKAGAHPHAVSFASQMWAARPHLGSIFEKMLHRKTFYLPVARILYLKRENHCNDILHFVEIYDILVTSNKQSDSR